MNASLIHLASIECWQRAQLSGVTRSGFIIMQAISAAGEEGISSRAMARECGFTNWECARRHLQDMLSLGMAYGVQIKREGRFDRPRKIYHLTEQGLILMTPQPRPRAERSAV